jgi:hypothetical protein
LAWAEREHRILLTFDKDFGELARIGAAAHPWCRVAADADAEAGGGGTTAGRA